MNTVPPTKSTAPAEAVAQSSTRRYIIIGVTAAVAFAFLYMVRDVLPPFLIAFFLASLMDPLVQYQVDRGRSRSVAVFGIFTLAFLLLVLSLIVIVPPAATQVQDFTANANYYSTQVTNRVNSWYSAHHQILATLGVKNNPLQDSSGPLAAAAEVAVGRIKEALLGFAGHVVWLLVIPLALVYFLMEYPSIRARLIGLTPYQHQASLDKISHEIVEIFSQYFRSLAVVCVLYGATAAVIFSVLGLRHGLLVAIATGCLYAVPILGPAITTVIATLAALSMNSVVVQPFNITLTPALYAVLVLTAYLIMHVTFDYLITPRIIGGSVGLHPLVNIFTLMCGATLFGVWGMLLAVPVGASIQLILIYFYPALTAKPASMWDPEDSTTAPPRSARAATKQRPAV